MAELGDSQGLSGEYSQTRVETWLPKAPSPACLGLRLEVISWGSRELDSYVVYAMGLKGAELDSGNILRESRKLALLR